MTHKFSPWGRLPATLITLAACLCNVSAYAAEASSNDGSGKVHPVDDVKKAGKEVGHGVKKTTKAIGHGFRDGARAVGHGTKEATREVGHETRDATREVGHAARDEVHKVEGKKD